MNIANAIRSSVADQMRKKDNGYFTLDDYEKIIHELKAMSITPGYIINVEDVQHSDTHCYALFGDGSLLIIYAKGKISALSVSGV